MRSGQKKFWTVSQMLCIVYIARNSTETIYKANNTSHDRNSLFKIQTRHPLQKQENPVLMDLHINPFSYIALAETDYNELCADPNLIDSGLLMLAVIKGLLDSPCHHFLFSTRERGNKQQSNKTKQTLLAQSKLQMFKWGTQKQNFGWHDWVIRGRGSIESDSSITYPSCQASSSHNTLHKVHIQHTTSLLGFSGSCKPTTSHAFGVSITY